MKFRQWCESEFESGLGTGTPEMSQVNRGSDTPGSDEVKRRGLQPQVDTEDVDEKADNQDQLGAIDSGIEHLSAAIPRDTNNPKVNKFKELLDMLRNQWDKVKMQKSDAEPEQGLGQAEDPKYTDTMRQFPNMVPVQDYSGPHGPGIFGQS